MLQSWLDHTTAIKESATYATVLQRIFDAQKAGQVPESVVKDYQVFCRGLSQLLAPISGIYVPGHDLDSSLAVTVRYTLESLYPKIDHVWLKDPAILGNISDEAKIIINTLCQNWGRSTE